MNVPSRADRIAALLGVVPKLPLFEPRSVLFSPSKAVAAPRVFTSVSIAGNPDFTDACARELGVDERFVRDQEEYTEDDPPPRDATLEEALADLLGRDRLMSPDEYGERFLEREDPTALVWVLILPLLDATKTRARLAVQLQSPFGAVDAIAWARLAGSDWVVESWRLDA